MQAGDVIIEGIDSITKSGISVRCRTIEEIDDASGSPVLVKGKRRRYAVGRGDFRVDPANPDSDLDEAAYTAAVEAEIEKIAPAAKHQAKIEAARALISDLREKIQTRNDRIADLGAKLTQRNDQIATLQDRIAELEGRLNA